MAHPFALDGWRGGVVDRAHRPRRANRSIARPLSVDALHLSAVLLLGLCRLREGLRVIPLLGAPSSTCSMIGAFALVGAFVRRARSGLVNYRGGRPLRDHVQDHRSLDGSHPAWTRSSSRALFLGGAYARFGDTPVKAALGGLSSFSGSSQKQTKFVLAAPVLITAVWLDRRRGRSSSRGPLPVSPSARSGGWTSRRTTGFAITYSGGAQTYDHWTEWHRFFVRRSGSRCRSRSRLPSSRSRAGR